MKFPVRWSLPAMAMCICLCATDFLPLSSPAILTAADPASPLVASKPNIVLIIADDMGAEDYGAGGNPHVRTPNIDRLAKAGLSFNNAMLTCSSCSPSRSSIITCRYPHNTDAEQLHWPLPAEQVTFVELLKEAGYYTAASGKWHLGNAVKNRFDKVDEASAAGFQLPADAAGAAQAVLEDKQNASGCANWVKTLEERPRDKPFFLWLAALDPHRDYAANIIPRPHTPEEVVVPPYLPDTPKVRADLALYYDEIARLDGYVGRVLDELDRQQIADQTLVVFMTDNGRPFPRCKTTLYESGIRTPLLVRWPARIAAGQKSDALVSSIDLGATFLELAGVQPKASMQGQSFASVLADPSRKHRDFAFAEHNWHDYDAFERAVRSPRYKYIRNLDATLPLTPPADAVRSPTFVEMRRLRDAKQLPSEQSQCFAAPRPEEEFYDLQSDPHELNNLLGAHPSVQGGLLASEIERHRAALDAWRRETKDLENVRAPDEFDRESGLALPNRQRPRPSKSKLRL